MWSISMGTSPCLIHRYVFFSVSTTFVSHTSRYFVMRPPAPRVRMTSPVSGTCGTCVERREAFLKAGLVDPTVYANSEALPPAPAGS